MRRSPLLISVLLAAMLLAEGCGTLSRLIPGINREQSAAPSGAARTGGLSSGGNSAGEIAVGGIGTPQGISMPEAGSATLTPLQQRLIATAKSKIGCRYKYAAKGPDSFDCSGFMMYVFGKEGIRLNAGSASQYGQGRALGKNEPLRPCDLVFFSGSRISDTVGHVGMVLDYDKKTGTFTFIHASCSEGIEIQRSSADYYARRYIGARRILDE